MCIFNLNDHHQSAVDTFLKFSQYQRTQRLKCIKACFNDIKNTRLHDDTYSAEEVDDILLSLREAITVEVEGELIHSTYTNSLLLADLFAQAQKWHLDLIVNTAQLENKELIEKIKTFEESRLSSVSPVKKGSLTPLQPTSEPLELLQREIQKMRKENEKLKEKVFGLEKQAETTLFEKDELQSDLAALGDNVNSLRDHLLARPSTEEVEEMSSEVEKIRQGMEDSKMKHQNEHKDLLLDLSSMKHQLQTVQMQLELAEMELEKKFSQTLAYKNLKLMINRKNEQIKELRIELRKYESEEVIED